MNKLTRASTKFGFQIAPEVTQGAEAELHKARVSIVEYNFREILALFDSDFAQGRTQINNEIKAFKKGGIMLGRDLQPSLWKFSSLMVRGQPLA